MPFFHLLVLAAATFSPQSCRPRTQPAQKPNIVFFLIDDWGYGDYGQDAASYMQTPNIKAIADQGLELEAYHADSLCTPSRAALMTGRAPHRYGAQNGAFTTGDNIGLDLDEELLSERLRTQGYRTHLVGKWHLGYAQPAQHPLARGFDSFYGLYSQAIDHFSHESFGIGNSWAPFPPEQALGRDLHRGYARASADTGQYTTTLFTQEAVAIIDQHDAADPLFLLLSYDAVHNPIQPPSEAYTQQMCGGLNNPLLLADAQQTFQHESWNLMTLEIDAILRASGQNLSLAQTIGQPSPQDQQWRQQYVLQRRRLCGMLRAVDDSIGAVVAALQTKGLWDNTLVVVTSDNGGNIILDGASNRPFYGMKAQGFEGGSHVRAFVSGLGLPCGQKRGGLMTVADWFPTFDFLSRADQTFDLLDPLVTNADLDGLNQWNYLNLGFLNLRQSIITDVGDPTYYGLPTFSVVKNIPFYGRYKLTINPRMFTHRLILQACQTNPHPLCLQLPYSQNDGAWSSEVVHVNDSYSVPLDLGDMGLWDLDAAGGELAANNLWDSSDPTHLAVAKYLFQIFLRTVDESQPGLSAAEPRNPLSNPNLRGCALNVCSECTQTYDPVLKTVSPLNGAVCVPFDATLCVTLLVGQPCVGGWHEPWDLSVGASATAGFGGGVDSRTAVVAIAVLAVLAVVLGAMWVLRARPAPKPEQSAAVDLETKTILESTHVYSE